LVVAAVVIGSGGSPAAAQVQVIAPSSATVSASPPAVVHSHDPSMSASGRRPHPVFRGRAAGQFLHDWVKL
jgi:hypothetical protein